MCGGEQLFKGTNELYKLEDLYKMKEKDWSKRTNQKTSRLMTLEFMKKPCPLPETDKVSRKEFPYWIQCLIKHTSFIVKERMLSFHEVVFSFSSLALLIATNVFLSIKNAEAVSFMSWTPSTKTGLCESVTSQSAESTPCQLQSRVWTWKSLWAGRCTSFWNWGSPTEHLWGQKGWGAKTFRQMC